MHCATEKHVTGLADNEFRSTKITITVLFVLAKAMAFSIGCATLSIMWTPTDILVLKKENLESNFEVNISSLRARKAKSTNLFPPR